MADLVFIAVTFGFFALSMVYALFCDTLYLLVPICPVLATFLVSQGMIQNFKPCETAKLVESINVPGQDPVTQQTIVQGPMASQAAIKMLGTNGGGYTNANSAQPFENPTPLSNFLPALALGPVVARFLMHEGSMF